MTGFLSTTLSSPCCQSTLMYSFCWIGWTKGWVMKTSASTGKVLGVTLFWTMGSLTIGLKVFSIVSLGWNWTSALILLSWGWTTKLLLTMSPSMLICCLLCSFLYWTSLVTGSLMMTWSSSLLYSGLICSTVWLIFGSITILCLVGSMTYSVTTLGCPIILSVMILGLAVILWVITLGLIWILYSVTYAF